MGSLFQLSILTVHFDCERSDLPFRVQSASTSKLKAKRKMSEIFENNNNKLSILSETGGEVGMMAGLATSDLCGLASLVGQAAMAAGQFSTLDAGPRQRV